jgi:hypothetical protein
MRLGIAHHLGWAVAVTVSARYEVVDAGGSSSSNQAHRRRRSITKASPSTARLSRRW